MVYIRFSLQSREFGQFPINGTTSIQLCSKFSFLTMVIIVTLNESTIEQNQQHQWWNAFQILSNCTILFPPAGREGKGCQNLIPSRPASHLVFWQAVLARSDPWQYFELVSLSLCPGTMKELLSLCPEKLHCPFLLEMLFHINIVNLIIC